MLALPRLHTDSPLYVHVPIEEDTTEKALSIYIRQRPPTSVKPIIFAPTIISLVAIAEAIILLLPQSSASRDCLNKETYSKLKSPVPQCMYSAAFSQHKTQKDGRDVD